MRVFEQLRMGGIPSMSSKPKTQKEKDEEELREVEAKLTQILDLLTQRKGRQVAEDELEQARKSHEIHEGNKQPVMHITQKHHVPTTMHTKTVLDLAEKIKQKIEVCKFGQELETALRNHAGKYLEILERILSRQG